MHRTQILLDEAQYLALKQLAREKGKSMGQIVREFVDRGLRESTRSVGGLEAIRRFAGLIDRAEGNGRNHDETLYGDER